MAIKAVNNTAGLNRLVPTLLVYRAYLRISNLDSPTPSIIERAAAIRKAMTEIVKLRAKQAINNALYHRNGPNTTPVHDLPLTSKVLVEQKSGNWTRPYYLLAVEDETCCVQLSSRLTRFKSTSIKPYFRPKTTHDVKLDKLEVPLPTLEVPQEPTELAVKYSRGRP